MATPTTGLSAMEAFAVIGVAGVGAQWLAWRLRMPAIVLMLTAGLVLGPVTGILVPARDIGPLIAPMVSLAVSVILFEGGLTLNFHRLADARPAVRRLVYVGAPLGWLLSTLALIWIGGLSWKASLVFGGIMIVTGPTVIAPLLRQAKLVTRPAQVLQWEGIVNDPIGALAAALAMQIVLVANAGLFWGQALARVVPGVLAACLIGIAAGWAIVQAFRRHIVPEYMKVPVLFVTVIGAFTAADSILHESGLLAVTLMGLIVANANLPSYTELYRFKEQATVLLVSGVFIILAAGIQFSQLTQLSWRAFLLIAAVILLVRPATVMLSLIGTNLPMKERLLIAFTGPRGVVLVAVSGIFAERLVAEGVPDGGMVAPLAFCLVLATVILHGFTLGPLARRLGLTSGDTPGVMIVGGSPFATGLAQALIKEGVEVLVTDPNRDHLRSARTAGVPTYYGDVLGEAAETNVEFLAYTYVVAASDNDAYNTLVATDLAPDFGREVIWQVARENDDRPRHSLPSQLRGQGFGGGLTLARLNEMLAEGWVFRTTRLTEEYGVEEWRAARPGAVPLVTLDDEADRIVMVSDPERIPDQPGLRIVSLIPPELAARIRAAANDTRLQRAADDNADALDV